MNLFVVSVVILDVRASVPVAARDRLKVVELVPLGMLIHDADAGADPLDTHVVLSDVW
jgi:hypothetical protein